jgi:hypothetical protein
MPRDEIDMMFSRCQSPHARKVRPTGKKNCRKSNRLGAPAIDRAGMGRADDVIVGSERWQGKNRKILADSGDFLPGLTTRWRISQQEVHIALLRQVAVCLANADVRAG